MTDDELSGAPPASAARPGSEWPALEPPGSEWGSMRSGAVRAYRDDALLERVRHRLDAHPLRRQRSRVVWQAAAALILFGIGVGVGRGLPDFPSASRVATEVARATAETRTNPAATARQRSPAEREPRARPTLRRVERKRPTQVTPPDVALSVPEVAIDLEEASGVVVPPPMEVASAPRGRWLAMAEEGDYGGALAELERSQAAHLVLATGSVEELMTMAEVARFAGSQERAIQALSQVVDRYRGDPNAPLAAMMLGNLLSRAGDSTGAARAFALNRTLSPGGDFAEDALVREFDLALAADNVGLASSLFDQYAREFPAGPHLYAMRYELDELMAKSEEAPPAEAPPVSPTERGGDAPGESLPSEDEAD